MIKVGYISTNETRKLRFEVLWPHKEKMEACVLPTDDLTTTFHIGVKENNEIKSVGTFLKEINPTFDFQRQYRLRAMATDKKEQGKNFGKKLIQFAVEELQKKGIELLWCDARKIAIQFYEAIGFKSIGDYYEIPIIGQHKLMYYVIPKKR
jgi:GNAT superfamily N-acetyltransferase